MLIFSLAISAQSPDWDRVERISANALERYTIEGSLYPTWAKEGPYCIYNKLVNGKRCHYLVNAKNGKKREMIKNNDLFAGQFAQITGDTLDKENIKLYGIRFEKNNFTRFFLDRKGKTVGYDMDSGRMFEVPYAKKEKGYQMFKNTSHTSDSLFTMLGAGYDLFVRDNKRGQIKRITMDGKDEASYTYNNSKDTLESNSKGFWIGHYYVLLLQDMNEVENISIVQSVDSPRPRTTTFKMPMPGESGVRQYRIFWYNADKGEAKMLPIQKYADQVVDMNYFRSETNLYFTRRNRKADKIDLCRIDIQQGQVIELISETCAPHFNLTLFNYKIIDQGEYFIWWSERTGRGNYYLYDKNGKLLNRITQGQKLVAGAISLIDTLKREIIFAGYGNEEGINPYYTFFYKASLNGKKQILLTPGDGNHDLSFSEDRKYAIDTYSRMNLLPVMRVLSINEPKKNYEIDRINDTELRATGWQPPILLKLKAADRRTDLYGVMYLPSNLDENKKYPIITNVYPGPQDDQIPQSYTLDDNGNQSLAELGFIVINVASRGSSPLRGHDFYCFGYGNLRDYPLPDDKYVIEQLAERYPYIDLERVGIYGHSGGGFQTVAAMLTYPDFYKVGIAASGNHDNNIYIQWWGEVFHGLSEKLNPKTGKTDFSVKIPTNMELASNLKGKLLLITGDIDRNVPPASTYRMADALIKANKRFDMFILPGKDHGVMCAYYQNLIRYYFVENLGNLSSRHIDIINHK